MPVVALTHTNPLMSLGVFSFSFCFGERVEEGCNLVFFWDITDETLPSYIKQSTQQRGKARTKKEELEAQQPKGCHKGAKEQIISVVKSLNGLGLLLWKSQSPPGLVSDWMIWVGIQRGRLDWRTSRTKELRLCCHLGIFVEWNGCLH